MTSAADMAEDINSPTDSVIGRDFQELSAEEQERQREEWKAELKKTEEEILTLKQVLTAKERHAAGLKRRLGITAWREFSEDMTQGLKNLQESATYKRTAENIQFAKDIAKEKTSGMVAGITASGYFQSMSSAFGAAKTKISTSMSQQSFSDVTKEQNGAAENGAGLDAKTHNSLVHVNTCYGDISIMGSCIFWNFYLTAIFICTFKEKEITFAALL